MVEFENKQFDGCAKILKKLVSTRAADPKVYHNTSVFDYYHSGLRATDEFMSQLAKVCEMVSS